MEVTSELEQITSPPEFNRAGLGPSSPMISTAGNFGVPAMALYASRPPQAHLMITTDSDALADFWFNFENPFVILKFPSVPP